MSTIPANSNLIPIDIAINYSTECGNYTKDHYKNLFVNFYFI